ncbi:PREDICTED: uncharacterized protein LOC104738072 [Camelina sativa]|uniref:ATP-dependent DNA helicase n=1 Tax=Camelina sativa TaxID=90675 RepID=A0ABM0VIB4_CAMSA|nr:PREDICTED: uncharacterized protein LOC104738072 [Camelina sativa]
MSDDAAPLNFVERPNPIDTRGGYLDHGDPEYKCQFCGAFMWYDERLNKRRNANNPSFSLCFLQGTVQLPLFKESPEFIKKMLTGTDRLSKHFQNNLRGYDMVFAITSLGGKVDKTVHQGKGPNMFQLQGSNYHLIGSMKPKEKDYAKFSQLYNVDTENEVPNRQTVMSKSKTSTTGGGKKNLKKEIIEPLIKMLDEVNLYVKHFRAASYRFASNADETFHMRIISDRVGLDGRNYTNPTVPEIAALIPGDFVKEMPERDIIIEEKTTGSLQRISEIHPSYLALQYLLIHIFGEDGFRPGIQKGFLGKPKTKKTKCISMRQWFAFRIQEREAESNTLLLSRRLFQQYVVDAYTAIESNRLKYIKLNQSKIRYENYSSIKEAAESWDINMGEQGNPISIPSLFTGGPRYMVQSYYDAMAICKHYGFPDLFITFTCNPKCPEITRYVKEHGLNANDRPDIICRIFKIKLESLMFDVTEKKLLGKTVAAMYTMEFQKRGLPHAHILLFMDQKSKLPTSDEINNIICVEIPDKDNKPELYEIIKDSMIHGLCGAANKNSPCMVDGKCSKMYPKSHSELNRVGKDGYSIYRRRRSSSFIEKGDFNCDNRWVVPYNEKYVSTAEAIWRIYKFPIQFRTTPVQKLSFHIEGKKPCYFRKDANIDEVLEKSINEDSQLTAWFYLNQINPTANQYLYSKIPAHYTWQGQRKQWRERKKGFSLGRINYVPRRMEPEYFMRILLNIFRGPKSFDDIKTYKGVIYNTYKEACFARGILDDDHIFIDSLLDAKKWCFGPQLRNLFANMILSECLSRPDHVWEQTWEHLSEDIKVMKRNEYNNPDLNLTDADKRNYTLVEIEKLMLMNGSSLLGIENLPKPSRESIDNSNHLIVEEMKYNREEQKEKHDNWEEFFFVYGFGGTGKTFMWKTLSAAVRYCGMIVLNTTSSGIASLLLPGGRTAHSRFGIPITPDDNTSCTMTPNSDVAKLMEEASLIIWDEAPMMSKYCFENLDRSLNDCVGKFGTKPFGGKVVVFGGDFRQILPVIHGAGRAEIVLSALNASYLWEHCKVLKLTKNMRLLSNKLSVDQAKEIIEFSNWILDGGDGKISEPNDGEALIDILEEFLITNVDDPIEAISREIYGDVELLQEKKDPTFFQERAILAPTNDDVNTINQSMLDKLPGEEKIYSSSDSIDPTDLESAENLIFTPVFLNSIKISGLPMHSLRLKIGAHVMLLRNLDPKGGLCNGTRLQVTQMADHVLEAMVITGDRARDLVLIPQIFIKPSDTKLPFKMRRTQFPIAFAFAMTINKSQGQSLTEVGLYLPRPVFSHGQLYIALSRVTSKKGLQILIVDKKGQI